MIALNATTIAYTLAGLIAAAIIFIGGRFIIAPRVAAAGYGVPADLGQQAAAAYLRVKGIRDIASGLFVFLLMGAGATNLLGWVILAATIIPLADAVIVLANGGTRSIAFGVHGMTAAVMIATSLLLLTS